MLTVLFLTFLVLLLINMPIAFALGIAAAVTLLVDDTLPINSIVTRAFVGVDSFTLLAIPFFIIAGQLMNACGITERIVEFARSLVGHIRGGLAHVSIVASMFFSGISGSATADASAMGSMLIPAMKKNGFDSDYTVAVNASSSAIGPIIPPSIMMVIYGSIANVSIAQLFLGGFVPGLLVGFGLMAMAYFIAVQRNYPAIPRSELTPIFTAFKDAALSLAMPVIILGGIFSGIFTATEAAAIAVVYSFVLAFIVYREVKFRDIPDILIKSVTTTAIVMFLIGGSMALSWVLSFLNIPQSLSTFLLSLSDNKLLIMLIINAILLFVGTFMDMTPAVLIFRNSCQT